MWEYTFMDVDPYALYHYGTLGQKWGIRRYQNPDGTLTEAGKRRYWGNGSDYTNVGRKRYIKDLVKDYNQINGTNVNLRKAVVRVDGKYFTGKGVELDPKDTSIIRAENKSATVRKGKKEYETITNDSLKRQIDEKPNTQMTKDELRIAKEYYEQLNGYEEAGAKYAKRHMSKEQMAKEERAKFFTESGKTFVQKMIPVIATGVAAVAVYKLKKSSGMINDSKKDD